MKRIYLILCVLLFSVQAFSQTTPWSSSPPVTPQTRSFSGAKQIRWLWGSNTLYSLDDSLAKYKLKTDSINNSGYVTHGYLNAHAIYTASNGITKTGNNFTWGDSNPLTAPVSITATGANGITQTLYDDISAPTKIVQMSLTNSGGAQGGFGGLDLITGDSFAISASAVSALIRSQKTSLQFLIAGNIITDTHASPKGIEYAANYNGTLGANSLVPKRMLDSVAKAKADSVAAAHPGTGGTVTSITPGYGHTSSTPITTSGTITIDTTKLLTVLNTFPKNDTRYYTKTATDAKYLIGSNQLSELSSYTNATAARTNLNVDSVGNQPNYFYTGSNFFKARLNIANNSAIITNVGGTQAPTNLVFIGDSRMGFIPGGLRDALGQNSAIAGLGFCGFYVNNYPSDLTFSLTGTYTTTRDDNTSSANWGINGSRLDASTGMTATFTPSERFRFDAFRIWYDKVSGGGSFTYTIDGGSPVTVNTANASEVLGITTVNTGILNNTTHTIVLSVTSGPVRFYGVDFYNKKQNGIVVHVLNSGGSQAVQWNGNVGYTQQFVSTVTPALCTIWLGRNDAIASVTPTNYVNALSGIISGLSLPANCPVVLCTETPQGLSPTGPVDGTDLALINQYRAALLPFAKTNGHSVFDILNYWGSYAYMQAQGYYSDAVHPTFSGAYYLWSGLSKNLMQVFNNELLMGYDYFPKSNVYYPTDGITGFQAATAQTSGGQVASNTGYFFNSNGSLIYKKANINQIVYNEQSAIQSMFPTTTYPNFFKVYRQGSTSNLAFTAIVNADVSTSFVLGNAPLNINANALLLGTSTTANNNAILDMVNITTKGVLFPQLTSTTANALVSPTTSLFYWDTTLGIFRYRIPTGGGQFVSVLNDFHPTFQAGTASFPAFNIPAGTNVATPVAGNVEFDGTDLFYTITSGPTRRTVANLIGTQTFQNKTLTSSTNIIGGVTMGIGSDALGDIAYTGASNVLTRLAGNTTTTQKFLTSIGNGTISAAPTYFDLFGGTNTWGGGQTYNGAVNLNAGANFKGGISSAFYNTANTFSILLGVNTITGNRSQTLQDKDGVVALTSDAPIAASFSGTGTATTTFTVTIGATQANTTYKVNVTPTSLVAAAVFYVTNKTTTTFDVVYVTGLTGAVSFDWSLFK